MNIFRLHFRSITLSIFLLVLTLMAGAALLGLAGHFLTAAALAGVTAMGFNFFGPSAGIRALTFIRILSRYAEKLVGHDVTLRLARDLRVDLFRRLLPLAPLGLGRHRVGDLLARLIADIESVDGLLVRATGPLLAFALFGIVAVTVTLSLLPAAGLLLALVLLAVGAGIPLLGGRITRRIEDQRAQSRAWLRACVLESIEGATDVAAMHATARAMQRIDLASVAVGDDERARKQRFSLITLLHSIVIAFALPTMLWLLLQAADDSRLAPAAAGGLFFLAVAVFEAGNGMIGAWQSLHAGLASRQRLRQVIAQDSSLPEPAEATLVPAFADLEFVDVAFHWPDETRDVLVKADFHLAAGERVVLSGDSGVGKSSLIALALRLCDPQNGSVRYGGVDVREFRQSDWHAHVAWLPQDATVFAGSVRENLRMGDPQASDARLWAALSQVRMQEAIRWLPEELDAWIGENGATLSTGQSRRIALARALLRDTPLLLLDEPTEGLDSDTARDLLLDIAAASGSRSVLMVSHDEVPEGVAHHHYTLLEGRLVKRVA